MERIFKKHFKNVLVDKLKEKLPYFELTAIKLTIEERYRSTLVGGEIFLNGMFFRA